MSIVWVNGVNLRSELLDNIRYSGGQVNVSFTGIPGVQYEIRRWASATSPVYTVLLVTNAPPEGLFSFTDTNPPSPSGFYGTALR